jgi:hypothetical protein
MLDASRGCVMIPGMRKRFARLLCWPMVAAIVTIDLPSVAQIPSNSMTVDELRSMYPTAEMKQVTIDEFEAITNDPGAQTTVIVEPGLDAGARTNVTRQSQSAPTPEPSRRRPRPAPNEDVVVVDDWSVNIFGSVDVDNADVAAVVFVLVGVVVVAAAVVYAGAFAYQALTSSGEEYAWWLDGGAQGYAFFGGERSGGMYGLRLAGGFMGAYADTGLAVEGGYLHGQVRVGDTDQAVDVSSAYGMLGPTVRWVLTGIENPMMLELELLVGLAADDNLDLLSRATAGLSWGVGSDWRAGIAVGSLYTEVHTTEGPATTDSSFNLTSGVQMGRRF